MSSIFWKSGETGSKSHREHRNSLMPRKSAVCNASGKSALFSSFIHGLAPNFHRVGYYVKGQNCQFSCKSVVKWTFYRTFIITLRTIKELRPFAGQHFWTFCSARTVLYLEFVQWDSIAPSNQKTAAYTLTNPGGPNGLTLANQRTEPYSRGMFGSVYGNTYTAHSLSARNVLCFICCCEEWLVPSKPPVNPLEERPRGSSWQPRPPGKVPHLLEEWKSPIDTGVHDGNFIDGNFCAALFRSTSFDLIAWSWLIFKWRY